MNTRIVLVQACAAALAAGCAMQPASVPPPPPPPAVFDCPQVCVITVVETGDPDHPSVNHPFVRVTRPNTHIYWQLPGALEFDANLGDGVFFKTANSTDFVDRFPTNTAPGPSPVPSAKGARFHWLDLKLTPGQYEYKIHFRTQNGKTRIVDPIIMNDL